MSARDRILARLRAAAPQSQDNTPANPDVGSWYAAYRSKESPADKALRFRQCIKQAHAEVHGVTPESWPQVLRDILASRRIERLLVAPGTPHGERVLDTLPQTGIEVTEYDMAIEAWKTEMFNATPASLTAARSAIAETGTLILWPDAAEPRLMSLVPPVHIVLLDARRIHDTFYGAMQAEGWADGLPTNALLISGPSKTADIQQTLAYGAHGPKELIVLLIEENPA